MIDMYFKDLASGIEQSLQEGRGGASARKKYALEVARLGVRLYSEDQVVALCGVLAPFDLLNSMGVTSCFVEFIGAMLASMGAVDKTLAAAEDLGYPTDLCSYHRAIIGAAESGLMPAPDFLIATTSPCSAGLATIETLSKKYGKDLRVLHIPYNDDAGSVEYLAAQIKSLTQFVAAHTGRPFVMDDLVEAIDLTNRARALMVEVFDLASCVPTPARRSDMMNFAFIMSLLLGTEAAVDLARTYRDEFAAKVKEGVGGVPGERVRLLWFQNRIQFKSPLEKMLEEEFGAAVAVDELNVINWEPIDPAHPFESIARRTLSNPLTGPVDRRIENLVKLIRSNRVDGVLLPCHWGCRQGTGARGLIEKALAKEGVPSLNLEVDCVDPRNFAIGQLRTRLTAFIETIEARKAV